MGTLANDIGANITRVDAVLKQRYLKPVQEQLNLTTLLMRRLSRNEEIVEGREVVFPLHTGQNVSPLAVREGGRLPKAGQQQYVTNRFPIPYVYGAIQISGPLIAAARSQLGAFVRALDSEVKGLVRDFRADENRMLFSDGSGRIVTATGAPAGQVLGVRHVHDHTNQGTGVKFAKIGDRMAVVDVSAAATITALGLDLGTACGTITAIDNLNKTITFSASPVLGAIAAGDHLVRVADESVAIDENQTSYRGRVNTAGNVANANREIMGLVGICSGASGNNWSKGASAYVSLGTGVAFAHEYAGPTVVTADLQGVSGTTTPTWVANTFFNGGVPRNLTTQAMQIVQDANEELGQASATIIITTFGCRRAYLNLLVPDRRYPNIFKLDGGFEALDHNGIPMVVDKDCPPGVMFFLNENDLAIAQMAAHNWMDKDGSVLQRVVGPRVDAYQAEMYHYAELVCFRRNSQGVLGDIREAV